MKRESRERGMAPSLMCFGEMVAALDSRPWWHRARRDRGFQQLVELLDSLELDGVDYNWEYPAMTFALATKKRY